jgi:hypothetical protein
MSVISESSLALVRRAESLVVNTPPTRQDAASLWDLIRTARKQEEANKETTCRPLKTAWDQAKVPFDEFIKKCEAAEKKMQAAMSAWDREQERLAKIEQAKIQAKIDADNARKLAKAEEKGKDLSEVVLKVAPVVQAPPKSIETQAGTTQTRSTKKVYKPKDLKSLMAAFPDLFELSMPKFNALAKTGMLDGRADVEITEEYIYAQR